MGIFEGKQLYSFHFCHISLSVSSPKGKHKEQILSRICSLRSKFCVLRVDALKGLLTRKEKKKKDVTKVVSLYENGGII